MSARDARSAARLGAIRYSSGNFAKSLLESTFNFAYLFFLVDVLALEPGAVGAALLASMIIDALLNLLVGRLTDRFLHLNWSYRRMVRTASPLGAALFVLLFALPAAFPLHPMITVILAVSMFRFASTLVDVPHNALLADLTSDSRERIRLSSWRFFFSSLGNAAVLFCLWPALAAYGTLAKTDFILQSVVIGCVFAIVISYSVGGAGRNSGGRPRLEVVHTLAALGDLAHNGRLLKILLVCILSAGFITVFMRMTIFFAKGWLGDATLSTYLVAAQMLGQIIGLPLWQRLATRNEKTSAAIAAQLLLAVVMLAFVLLQPTSLVLALLLFFGAGIGVGGLTVMNWAIVPDTIEYTEAACGRRHEALTFGTLLFLNKLASAFALASVGGLLSALEYGATEARSFSTPLVLVMGIVPLVGALGSALALGSLRITHREHAALKWEPGAS